jgi:multicomponent Na+:H+ antiporter subunit D
MNEIIVLLPVLIPFSAAAIALLIRRYERVQDAWALGAMFVSTLASVWLFWQVFHSPAPLVYQMGGWQAPFGIVLAADRLSAFMVLMSQIVLLGGILYGQTCKDKCVRYPTFFPLFLLLATALTGAFLTGDLFNLFVFAELLVVSGSILTAISDDRYGVEAAYKYFYISTVAGVFLLIACGSLYAAYGTLNMADLALKMQAGPAAPLARTAMVFLFAAFCVKSAVVPFHFWQPDFHTAAPTPVHAVLSSVVVKLGIYGFLRLSSLLYVEEAQALHQVLLVLAIAGIFLGGLGAAATYDAKRMLAYSTMGQLGFILAGIAWGTPAALAASLIYMFNHSLVKAAMLMLAGSVASRAPVKTARFDVIRGVGRSFPLIGLLYLLGGMGLAGLPPTNGFVSKLALFVSGLAAEQYLSLLFLALGSVISLIYVFRSFQIIWFEPLAPDSGPVKTKGDGLLAPALLIAGCVLLGLWGEPLLWAANQVVESLASPAAYIQAVLLLR